MTFRRSMETSDGSYPRAARRYYRKMVAPRKQVRNRNGRPSHLYLLLRSEQRLVGLQTHQEADPVSHFPYSSIINDQIFCSFTLLASEQHSPGRRNVGLQMPRLLNLSQRDRRKTSGNELGKENVLRESDGRVRHWRRRLDSWLFFQRRW